MTTGTVKLSQLDSAPNIELGDLIYVVKSGNINNKISYKADVQQLVTQFFNAPLPYVRVTSNSQLMNFNTGYEINSAGLCTLQLPTVAPFGSRLEIIGLTGGWKTLQGAGQSTQIGIMTSTPGVTGYIQSNQPTDSIAFVCILENTVWACIGAPQSNGIIFN